MRSRVDRAVDPRLVSCAVDAVHAAGRRIVALRAAARLDVTTKDHGRELVTDADLASDAILREALSAATPGAQWISEESLPASIDWQAPSWVVDPIDGTVNYVYGHAHVAVSIAWVVDGLPRLGVVHAPFTSETWVALRDGGATRDGVPLVRRTARPIEEALVATGFPHRRDDLASILERFARVVRRCRDVRRLASPALDVCWVADGRLDAAYETLRPWDVAAAGLVAREAGVACGRYGACAPEVPAELCGDDVAFARPELLSSLLDVLRG